MSDDVRVASESGTDSDSEPLAGPVWSGPSCQWPLNRDHRQCHGHMHGQTPGPNLKFPMPVAPPHPTRESGWILPIPGPDQTDFGDPEPPHPSQIGNRGTIMIPSILRIPRVFRVKIPPGSRAAAPTANGRCQCQCEHCQWQSRHGRSVTMRPHPARSPGRPGQGPD